MSNSIPGFEQLKYSNDNLADLNAQAICKRKEKEKRIAEEQAAKERYGYSEDSCPTSLELDFIPPSESSFDYVYGFFLLPVLFLPFSYLIFSPWDDDTIFDPAFQNIILLEARCISSEWELILKFNTYP
ncbi:hypothetical protein Tco_0733610 [Tanacetum coccineum]